MTSVLGTGNRDQVWVYRTNLEKVCTEAGIVVLLVKLLPVTMATYDSDIPYEHCQIEIQIFHFGSTSLQICLALVEDGTSNWTLMSM